MWSIQDAASWQSFIDIRPSLAIAVVAGVYMTLRIQVDMSVTKLVGLSWRFWSDVVDEIVTWLVNWWLDLIIAGHSAIYVSSLALRGIAIAWLKSIHIEAKIVVGSRSCSSHTVK